MSIANIKKKLILNSVADKQWKNEAKERIENEEWMDISFSIATKSIIAMKNKGLTQKQLAESLNCSPQYVSKLLKGKEKLNIETITKLQKVLSIRLIEVPREYIMDYQKPTFIFIPYAPPENKMEKKYDYSFANTNPRNLNDIKWKKLKNSYSDC